MSYYLVKPLKKFRINTVRIREAESMSERTHFFILTEMNTFE